jgi:predicted DNA-binding transcriptional regulator AlpA
MITWIKAGRVAELCGVRHLTIYQWKKRNQGPPFYRMPNGRLRWVEEEVMEWLRKSRKVPTN